MPCLVKKEEVEGLEPNSRALSDLTVKTLELNYVCIMAMKALRIGKIFDLVFNK